ncbi:MAG: tRNA (adenosine(37)-N6)-threonylcarbamoyltransferase complex ATPase subunit type 1 TsaE, partial [Candidatus Moranbacteria bacterium]|nr:tRNA (adenosine(37)-N6)-threonylcarbamoyltransferase complex ATPase subunit type 1 TsaE [Candidatus Moranbacteria bacterium]
MKTISENNKETHKLAQEVIENLEQGDNLILLRGELGAGKTTFSQGVLKYLEAEEPFTSPTFVIIKDYQIDFKNKKGVRFERVYHLDCYRVDSAGLLD